MLYFGFTKVVEFLLIKKQSVKFPNNFDVIIEHFKCIKTLQKKSQDLMNNNSDVLI